jgi:hypothetical protein
MTATATLQSQTSSGGIPMPPVILSGHELYDQIMGGIEPELTTKGRKLAELKYQNETPEQHEERMARYQRAFEEYERRYTDHKNKQQKQVMDFKKGLRGWVERKTQTKKEQKLANISHLILSA